MKDSKTVVGVDIAKRVFQVHEVDARTGELRRVQLKRAKFLEYFANRTPCLVGMEACGGAQHWARRLTAMGHEVKLLPARQVRPFAGGNKSDQADAQAIWTAVQQPGIKAVAVKTEAQQAVLALHRMRQQLVKFRTAQINALRGLLTEYGEVMPRGRTALRKGVVDAFARISERLPKVLVDTLREQFARIEHLDEEIAEIEQRLTSWFKHDEACRRIAAVPGVGMLTATAVVATMGDPSAFHSGREFAAWLGLVPRQRGTGGRVKLLGISKRGDTYVRTLLIQGARAVLLRGKSPPAWLVELAHRRPTNVAVVAQANKVARTLWALLAHKRTWDACYVSESA